MATFTAQQTASFKKLINAIHPDKVEDSRKELATKLAAMANAARDAGDFTTIQNMLDELASGAIWEESVKETKEQAKERAEDTTKKREPKAVVIDEKTLNEIRKAVKEGGYDRKRASGWILLNLGLNAREIKAYLDLIFTVETADGGSSRGEDGHRGRLYAKLAMGPMTDEEFEEYLKSASDNVRRNRGNLYRIVKMANTIWAAKK